MTRFHLARSCRCIDTLESPFFCIYSFGIVRWLRRVDREAIDLGLCHLNFNFQTRLMHCHCPLRLLIQVNFRNRCLRETRLGNPHSDFMTFPYQATGYNIIHICTRLKTCLVSGLRISVSDSYAIVLCYCTYILY